MNQKVKAKNKKSAKKIAVSFTDNAWEDYLHWQSEDPEIAAKINSLLNECMRDPFKGTGKPEALSGNLTGFWSRRINQEHRLVYLPEDGAIAVIACRYHYE